MLTSEIVSKIKTEGGFDSTASNSSDTTILGWVNELYREGSAESKWVRVPRDLTPTQVGGTQYALADDVVDVRMVRVGASRPYTRMSTEELWEAQAGLRFLSDGSPGAFAANFESDDDTVVEVWPASGGATITAFCSVIPSDLTLSPDTTPRWPPDLHNGLVEGGIGLGMQRIYERSDLAGPHTAKYEDVKKELARRTNARVGGGPVQAKIYGVHF